MARRGKRGQSKQIIVYQAPCQKNDAEVRRRRRRRARQAAARRAASLGSPGSPVSTQMGGFGNALAAPSALNVRQKSNAPIFKATSNGVIVRHSQRIGAINGSSGGLPFAYPMSPAQLGWIAQLAEHFQHFVIHEMKYRYVGRISTGSGGTVTMAPYYEATLPPEIEQGANGLFDFLQDLPGVQEFASWAIDQVGVVAKDFTRQIFRTVGFVKALPSSAPTDPTQESTNPGWVLGQCVDSSGGAGRWSGDLWCDYVVELSAPRSTISRSVQYLSASTDDADLALPTANYIGDKSIAVPYATNSLKFLRAGDYTIVIKRTGGTPVENTASIVATDQNGTVVTTKRVKDSVQAGVFGDNATFNDTGDQVGSSTVYLSVIYGRFQFGDYLQFPALSSGTLTSTHIRIIPASVNLVYES